MKKHEFEPAIKLIGEDQYIVEPPHRSAKQS